MNIKLTECKSCMNEPPTKDVMYVVIRLYKGEISAVMSTDYTVEYGWNTNFISHDHAIDYTDEDGWRNVWASCYIEDNNIK